MLVWDGFSWPTCVGDLHGSMQLLPEVKAAVLATSLSGRSLWASVWIHLVRITTTRNTLTMRGLLNLMHWEDTFINHGEIEYPVASASGPLAGRRGRGQHGSCPSDHGAPSCPRPRKCDLQAWIGDTRRAMTSCGDGCEARAGRGRSLASNRQPLSGFPTSRSFERFYVAHSITTKPRVRTANRRGGVQFGIDIVRSGDAVYRPVSSMATRPYAYRAKMTSASCRSRGSSQQALAGVFAPQDAFLPRVHERRRGEERVSPEYVPACQRQLRDANGAPTCTA